MGEYARRIRKAVPKCWPRGPLCDCMGPTPAIDCATLLMILFASLLRILHSTCAKRWNSAKILFAWYLLGWVAKRGCGTILRGGALWRRAFLANRGKETGP